MYQCYSLNSLHLLLIRAPKTAQKIKGRLKVMVPLIPAFPRVPSDFPLGGTPHQHLHLFRQGSRMGYLAAVSHQAPGRMDWHTESLRLNLPSAFWLTKPSPTSSRPQSEPRVLFKEVSPSLWLTFWIHLGRMYQDPLNPSGMLNSLKSDVVKKSK